MAITDHPEDNKVQQSSSSSSTFKADLNPSNPPGFSESAFNFVSRNSNLFMTESAEKQIHSIKAADEKEEEEKKLVPNTYRKRALFKAGSVHSRGDGYRWFSWLISVAYILHVEPTYFYMQCHGFYYYYYYYYLDSQK